MNPNTIIKQDPVQRLHLYLKKIQAADPMKGRRMALALYQKIADCITNSFNADVAPVSGATTENIINERLDKCVELCLALSDDGWPVVRIFDEIQELFFKKMRNESVEINKRSSWGVKETYQVEHDFSQEYTKGE